MLRLKTKTPLYLGAGVLICLLVAQCFASLLRPQLILNYTASMPIGIYKIVPVRTWRHGMVVVMNPSRPDRKLLSERGWLMKQGLLIKPVGALPGDEVCINNETVTVNGIERGSVFAKDTQGRPLPVLRGCFAIASGHLFPLSTHSAHSFDGRYFGSMAMAQVLGEAQPLWMF